LIAENAFDLIALVDSNGRYVYCNHSYLDILGYSPDDMIGRNCFDIVHPEDKEKAIQIFQKCLAEKTEKAHFVLRLLCHDGTIKWVDHRARIVVDECSGSMHVLLNATDITENKLADEALRQSKERLDKLAEQSRTIAWEVDAHGLFTYFSHVAENILGYTPEEVIGKLHFNDLHPEAGREEFKMAAFAIFEQKNPFLNLINVLQTKDGRQLWVSTNGIPMINADGTLRGYRGSDIDITERRQTDILLLESNELNRSMLQTIPFGMDIVDEEGNILFVNETFEKIIGSDAVGKKCWSIYRDDKLQCAGCPLYKGINIGLTDVYETDGVLGGRIFQISHTGMLFHGRKAMLEIFQDVTERVKSQQELISAKEHAEESDRLKTAFLNNISHEIRTPFNCILGFLGILDDDTLSRDERSNYTGMINQAAERLMNTINDIVEMSKIQTGQANVTLVETDINKLVREVSERSELQARINNLTFTVKNSLAASACSIKTDDDKLNSVLGILINNAIKFTKAGSIELTVQKNEACLEFSVKDTGAGIPEGKQHRIFKQFMQADVSNTRKFEGSGLGLAIAKAYVEMLGGSIDFESQVDKGSTFYFTIPDANTDAKAHDIPGTPTKMEPVRISSKILVTEDDEINFQYINAVLTRAGYEVLYARTGAEAVEICRNNMDIGTIFMDIKMPVMDGYIATREIRKFNPSIPIIAITAYAETGDRKKCLDAGMNDFASKPVTPRDMMEVLDKWRIKP
jgi:PAS domain S-box-containing protein